MITVGCPEIDRNQVLVDVEVIVVAGLDTTARGMEPNCRDDTAEYPTGTVNVTTTEEVIFALTGRQATIWL